MAVQHRLIKTMSAPEIQRRIDEIWEETEGVPTKFKAHLTKALWSEMYTPILLDLCLDASLAGIIQLTGSIQAQSQAYQPNFEMMNNWLTLEKLLRNTAGIKAAEKALSGWQQIEANNANSQK